MELHAILGLSVMYWYATAGTERYRGRSLHSFM